MWPWRPRPVPLALALQGGGAHGAFTWGVLDRLLEHPGWVPQAVSGASAGAVNAALLAQGWLEGGAAGARGVLRAFWEALSEEVLVDPVRLPADGGPPEVAAWFRQMLWWSRFWPARPAEDAAHDPLARLLRAHLDIPALRARPPLRLFLSATQALSGEARIFREHELSIEAIQASACLPSLRRAVEVDGEPYWDGGFVANPPLLPLLQQGGARDVLAILLMPPGTDALPQSPDAVRARLDELAFALPWRQAWQTVRGLQAVTPRTWHGRADWTRTRWHRIDGGPWLSTLPRETRWVPSATVLTLLHTQGRAAAHDWLERHATALGQHSTTDDA